MTVLPKEKLADILREFFRKDGACLFAGAGVGVKAGLPSWDEYISHLIGVSANYEEETAILMRKRFRDKQLIEAAHLYRICTAIPDGEKLKQLSLPFAAYDYKALRALMTLPFAAVVTTNYDRSLHDAYSSLYENRESSGLALESAYCVELDDLSIKQAIYWTNFYIARIHGRAEIPETIILDNDDYGRILSKTEYRQFLLHVLTRYRCLWIGYSFLDPAISKVFSLIKEYYPRPYPQLHLALIPSDSNPSLPATLLQYNIDVAVYDCSNQHEVLWESIKDAQRLLRKSPRSVPSPIESIPGLGRFIASSYSRLKFEKRAEPLLNIICEGIIAQLIFDEGERGVKKDTLIDALKQHLFLNADEIERIVRDGLRGLSDSGMCSIHGDVVICNPDNADNYNAALTSLIQSVQDRLKVREGIDADNRIRDAVSVTMNKIFLSRGWDLGAHFAGGAASADYEGWDSILSWLTDSLNKYSEIDAERVANAIFDLFRHPSSKEAVILTDIGRVSFGVELLLNNSRYAASEYTLIPETIYLDANVLMPAIVEGHPYNSVYADVISRLQRSAATNGKTINVFIAEEFLNEIISHRLLAVEHVNKFFLNDEKRLRDHILFYGPQNTNVFIGAYSSFIEGKKKPISFSEFLRNIAPYSDEKALAEYLRKHHTSTTSLSFADGLERNLYDRLFKALSEAYEEDAYYRKFSKPKAPVLIKHEAGQLTRLVLDVQAGRKPIFVTADKRLLGMCKGAELGQCASAVMSHLNFIQLVDLILGVDTDKKALSRLMWSVTLSDEKIAIRNYFIDLALQHYDEARAMAAWEVVDVITEKIASKAREGNIKIFSRDKDEKIVSTKFIDSFQDDYFKELARLIKKRENEE